MKHSLVGRVLTAIAVAMALVLAACTSANNAPNSAPPNAANRNAPSTDPAQAAALSKIVSDTITEKSLKSVIVRVTIDGKEILTGAWGDSMGGVPATTDMHFRNGAVAISYVSTLLLILVDEKKASLDDKVSKWLPEIPYSDRVTLGQLAQMTSGIADYVHNPAFVDANYANPFRRWTPQELIAYGTSQPLIYEPGTNWNYAHTNYVILGLALEKITGKKMPALLQEKVLGPLGLTNTTDNAGTPAIPEPVLHAFSSERRQPLKVPADVPFYEESTFWDPSWSITHGAIQTTDIYDMNETAIGVGTGKLLSPESYTAMTSTDLRGKTTAVPGCETCFPQSIGYTYGLGIVTTGDWLTQNPAFAGYGAVESYLPSKKIAISAAVTYDQAAFGPDGNWRYPDVNVADTLFRRMGVQLAPDDPPPIKK